MSRNNFGAGFWAAWAVGAVLAIDTYLFFADGFSGLKNYAYKMINQTISACSLDNSPKDSQRTEKLSELEK